MNIIKIPIGDWSKDGHNMSEDFYILSNYDVHKLRQAYKDSCSLMGLQFNNSDDFTGLKDNIDINDYRRRVLCTDYNSDSISNVALEIFRKFNCPFEEILDCQCIETTKDFVELLLWFIGKSLPDDFKWEYLKFDVLNGYWNNELNVSFGYGIFCD